MKTIIIAFIVAVTLLGCTSEKKIAVDQCLRRETFNEMLKNRPSGDDDVISKFAFEAYNMSRRPAHLIKPECFGDD